MSHHRFGTQRSTEGLSTLAVALHSARTAAGVTQATLAEHLGVSHAAVGMAETAKTGRISLGEDHLRAAAALFGDASGAAAIGKHLIRASGGPSYTIVGIEYPANDPD